MTLRQRPRCCQHTCPVSLSLPTTRSTVGRFSHGWRYVILSSGSSACLYRALLTRWSFLQRPQYHSLTSVNCVVFAATKLCLLSQIDNKGNHLLVAEEASINVPAIAAAHVTKRYTAQATDELTFEVTSRNLGIIALRIMGIRECFKLNFISLSVPIL